MSGRSWAASERNSTRELQDSRVVVLLCDLPKLRVPQLAVGTGELDAVKHVESFNSESERRVLVNVDIFEQ
jgi:hypothetical protein